MAKNIITSSKKVKELIANAFPIKRDNLIWHLNDRVYRLPYMAQVIEVVHGFIPGQYLPEIADCDNRALLLAAEFVKKGLTIGMIDVEQLDVGKNHPQYYHQLCLTIVGDRPTGDDLLEVYIIEPSTKNIYKPNDLLKLNFVDLRT